MIAARLQNRNDHKIRVGEQPPLGFSTCRLSRPRHSPQMLVSREAAEVVQAYAGQAGNFILGKDLLAGFDAHHAHPPNL
jgi:hypothetical protein